MDSEYNIGSKVAFGDDRLTFQAAVAMSDELLGRPTAFQDAVSYFNDLEITSPALFRTINDGAKDIFAVPVPMLDANGKLWYRCCLCGKPHDRKSRASDCRNSDLKLRPYKCRGECGNASCTKSYVSEQLLNRHWESGGEKIDCPNCDAQVLKQNLSRHMKSCMKG